MSEALLSYDQPLSGDCRMLRPETQPQQQPPEEMPRKTGDTVKLGPGDSKRSHTGTERIAMDEVHDVMALAQ